ncbi:hypothetical protein QOL99_07535 [Deinococcus sp. MIMF12]|uniref:Uncharacterized protein n=1 Tax=Deinococcus rhizophilus TaxID=3049544 RepID=A0ABT7JG27_9DEIO|nr:hypothetical protein [Deinococcus rhizophilus]MDL2344002.1 hypothetical protein [Deinococcus rhizophilus]
MSAAKKANRDRQWSRVRRVEFVYVAVMSVLIVGLFGYASLRPASDLVFWLVTGLTMLLGLGIWVRQYQVLDELGRLRFLKSWMVSGMVTLSSLTWALLWGIYEDVKRSGEAGTSGLPDVPFWFVYLSMLAGLVAMGLTNLYLRRQDERAE